MRTILIALLIVPLLAHGGWAQDAQPRNPSIENTIERQIEAFLVDDFATAFTFAAPNIQMIFRNPDNFGAMVRNGYPMVWRPDEVRFGELRSDNGRVLQTVIVTGPQGRVHVLEYQMQQIDGDWRIAGVRILEAPDLSA